MPSYLLWSAIAGLLLFVVIQSEYGLTYVYLLSERTLQVWKGFMFIMINHPNSPVVKYRAYRNSENNARKLAETLNLDKNKDWNK